MPRTTTPHRRGCRNVPPHAALSFLPPRTAAMPSQPLPQRVARQTRLPPVLCRGNAVHEPSSRPARTHQKRFPGKAAVPENVALLPVAIVSKQARCQQQYKSPSARRNACRA
jgi:hypothetical protein